MEIDLEVLQKQNNLTINNGKIFVKPTDRYSFDTFPLEDLEGTLQLSLEEYLGLKANYYRFSEDLLSLELNVDEE